MKVLFTCDLHGKIHLYKEMTSLALKSDATCIIMGGDLLPTHVGRPLGLITGNADFQEGLKAQYRFIDDFLVPHLDGFMQSHPDIRIVYTPGNHDWISAIERLQASLPWAACLHERAMDLEDIELFGYGCVTDSSFWVKDYARRDCKAHLPFPSRYALVSTGNGLEFSSGGDYALKRGSIEEELSSISFHNPSRTICIFHCPPYDTGLDTLYNGKPIGSRSIRGFIETHQPLMSLHGHIHESPYMSSLFSTKIGSTLSVNPGHSSRALHAVIFDTDNPEKSMIHSIFRKDMPGKGLGGTLLDRYGRKMKSLFMQKALSAKKEGS